MTTLTRFSRLNAKVRQADRLAISGPVLNTSQQLESMNLVDIVWYATNSINSLLCALGTSLRLILYKSCPALAHWLGRKYKFPRRRSTMSFGVVIVARLTPFFAK